MGDLELLVITIRAIAAIPQSILQRGKRHRNDVALLRSHGAGQQSRIIILRADGQFSTIIPCICGLEQRKAAVVAKTQAAEIGNRYQAFVAAETEGRVFGVDKARLPV